MLQEQINKDMIAAWKSGNIVSKNVLSYLLSKIKNKAIELRVDKLDDINTLSIIQKQIKELEDERDSYEKASKSDNVNVINNQIKIISTYLPKMLSEDEIKAEIEKLADKSMPSVMKHFKTNFAGKVDMGLVSKIVRGL